MPEPWLLSCSARLSWIGQVPFVGRVARGLKRRVGGSGRREWVLMQRGVAEGLWLKLDPKIALRYYEEEHDLALRRILQEHLRPGMVFYDLGANIGVVTLAVSKLLGPTGSVFSFEPEPELTERISEHLQRNSCSNVRLVRSAAWSETGFVKFVRDEASASTDRGQGRVVAQQTIDRTAIQVPCVALDDFVAKEAKPDFIKCDVEGAEMEVFRGARNILAEQKPIVECEIHSHEKGAQLTELLVHLGYTVRWYAANHFVAFPVPK